MKYPISAKGVSAVSVLALAIGFGGDLAFQLFDLTAGAASAQSSNGQGQSRGQSQTQGGKSDSTKGGQAQGGQGAKGGQGQGQAGPGEDSEGKGPQAGNAGSTRSGNPNWSQEGIPEVELGRLSVVRSPTYVLDRAYAEALASLSPEVAAFYSQDLQDIIADLSLNFDELTFIDSPLQNLALLRDALDGSISLPGVTNDNMTLMAVFLGVASDKTLPITTDTVVAVSTILGTPLTGTTAETLAKDAEEVRIAVLAGHG